VGAHHPTVDARRQLVSLLDLARREDLDLLDRFDRYAPDLIDALGELYDLKTTLPQLIDILAAQHRARPEALLQRDRERILEPDWFQKPATVGYACYTDLFAKNLKGITKRIPYLADLGVTYLHLMPLLKPRPGANDGGYAVMDYRSIRDDLGTMADLRATADKLHEAGISLTLDLVLNHVAQEHEWAEKAKAGDAAYRDYFFVYPDRKVPDQYEQTLLEVFPDFAPGNFTWNEELKGWVWTTFNTYQWDVNWANPAVFCEYADIAANLANQGVDCLRLDAIAFMWKRMGTQCQGEPEVHVITQALRAFARIAAPALIFKAEAIVGPAQVGAYFGEGTHAGKVSDLAYHNSLMVQLWAAIAAKDTTLLEKSLSRFTALPSTTAWGVYLRCHDDIGWAIDDTDAHQVGLNGHQHRMFLASYFNGSFADSDARGVDFQVDAVSGEGRTSGTAASLAGVQAALAAKNAVHLDIAVRRYLCAYAIVLGFGGIPLIYMGDEIGLLNDMSYLKDPAKAEDSRWANRPPMKWTAAERATTAIETSDNLSVVAEKSIRAGMQRLIEARKSLPALHASGAPQVSAGHGRGVAIISRRHPAGNLVQVYNLSNQERWVAAGELEGLTGIVTDHLTARDIDIADGLALAPYEALWLSA
jgi:amylosucrase